MTPPLPVDQFPVTERYRYLNHAGVAPLPRAAVDAIGAWAEDVAGGGATGWPARERRQEEVRAGTAALMGVAATDVALVKNTTEGLGFVASGLDWRPGDRVLVPGREFPSTLYPWLALRDRGVVVDTVEPVGTGEALPLERFADALAGAPTRVVCASWVQYGRGWRLDVPGLAALCHEHGALLCLDVIQGLGVIPCRLAEWDVDFAMADGHKWLLGPEGEGVLYVPAHRRDLLRPLEPGWNSVPHRDDFDHVELVWDPSARRFEGGTMNFAGIYGLGASIDLIAAAGVDAIWAHVDGLCDRLVDGLAGADVEVLSDRSPDGRSSIVTFAADDPETLSDALRADGFVCAARGGGLRVAPHGYNTADEIDALLGVLGVISGQK